MNHRLLAGFAAVCLTLRATSIATAVEPVELFVLSEENWHEAAPEGKEVDAIIGDVVLRNEHLVAVIAQPIASRHANMTVRDIAGAVVDLTARDAQSDQLSWFYPGRRRFPFRSWTAHVDGEDLELNEGTHRRGSRTTLNVVSEGTDDRPHVAVTYALEVHSPLLRVTTVFTNHSQNIQKVELVDDLRADHGKELFAVPPNGTLDRYWFEDRFWQQAYGFAAEGFQLQSNTTVRTSEIKYIRPEHPGTVELQPGETFSLERTLTAGRSLAHVDAAYAHASGNETTKAQFAVRDSSGRALAHSSVDLSRDGNHAGTLHANDRGIADAPLQPGDYVATIRFNGLDLMTTPVRIQSAAEQQQSLRVPEFVPGSLQVEVVDQDGRPLPAKIQLITAEGTPEPDFGPESAEFAVRNLLYAPSGSTSRSLHPGSYEVVVSRGPEYDAHFGTVEIEAGETETLRVTLNRSVDTRGWISADFHSHSSPSGDNTGSQLGRVINLVCEHIEFAPCTEHNRITTYQNHIDSLKIARHLFSCPGMELTGRPLPLNHQNAFPLHHHPHRQDGGGPLTDDDPATQIERLALWDNRSEKLVQQNHPDMGWLFYDKDGDGTPDEGFARGFGYMDVIEIHPIAAAWNLTKSRQPESDARNRVFHWLQLINQGRRIPGVVNTDAHYNFHGSGWLRNWLESPTDEPSKLKVLDLVHAAEHGHLIMSNGPFLEVSAVENGKDDEHAVLPGDDLAAPSGQVALRIRVQSPNWFDVDEVFVLVNGKYDPQRHYRRSDHPDRFGEGPVDFEQTIPVNLQADAHLVVVAGSPDASLVKVQGQQYGKHPPTALSNPIYVDVDGNGFKANGDTLGHPLPVKGGTPGQAD